MFITFEGIDGSGKTTQAKLLAEYFIKKGRDVLLVREPGSTEVGEKIRQILFDEKLSLHYMTNLYLFVAARAQLVSTVIKPALDTGKVVICDRFEDSTYAYQGYGNNIPLNILNDLCRHSTFGTQPNLTVCLDVPVGVGVLRRKNDLSKPVNNFDGLLESDYERIRGYYKTLSKIEPERVILINGFQGTKSVHLEIVNTIEYRISIDYTSKNY